MTSAQITGATPLEPSDVGSAVTGAGYALG
jgi:hypothetical protein